jgi:uncharacterized membrane protein YfcA
MGVNALDLAVFVSGSFVGALASQVAGFAYGFIAAAVWLQLLMPMQTVTLIIAFGPVVQGVAGWELRPTPEWRVLWPLLAGATIGVPVGVTILGWTDPAIMQAAIGALLILYGLGSLMLPAIVPIKSGGAAVDAGAGLLNGILSGAVGFTGLVIDAWCRLRAWPREIQRSVFQYVGLFVFVISAFCLGAQGAVNANVISLFVLGLPAVLIGTWFGKKIRDQVNEAEIRKILLILIVASGFVLALPRS